MNVIRTLRPEDLARMTKEPRTNLGINTQRPQRSDELHSTLYAETLRYAYCLLLTYVIRFVTRMLKK